MSELSVEMVALVLAGVSLVWQVGSWVSKKTKNKVDDALFDHPEVEEKLKDLVKLILSKK